MERIAIGISIIHIIYYVYVSVIYQLFVKIGTIYNTPHEEVFKLRSKYNVKIQTFRKQNRHWGFSLWKTVYLNERLFDVRKKVRNPHRALRWTFYHEYYHLKHHQRKAFLFRLILSCIPLLLLLPFKPAITVLVTVILYFAFAHYIDVMINTIFEKQANEYANKMIKNG